MSAALCFKRGSTWRMTGTLRDSAGALLDLTGWAVASKLRDPSGAEIASFTCSVHPDQVGHRGELEVYAAAAVTALWPAGGAVWDVALTDPGGDTDITRTVQVRIEEAVTR